MLFPLDYKNLSNQRKTLFPLYSIIFPFCSLSQEKIVFFLFYLMENFISIQFLFLFREIEKQIEVSFFFITSIFLE